MQRIFRIMAGGGSVYAAEARESGVIGVDWFPNEDLTGRLPDKWREFNAEFIPLYLKEHPEKSKIAAGLSCGFTWTVVKGIQVGDLVLTPNGKGQYFVGEITSDYLFAPGQNMPQRRKVNWFPDVIDRSAMTQELKYSAGAIGTVSELTKYSAELQTLINRPATAPLLDESSVEDEVAFALEAQLQQFLVANWDSTDLGKKYDIYQDEGDRVGVEYPTDTGRIDVLAISKDGSELLVVELKRGRVSDKVVGQIQRYMGFVVEELAGPNQKVRGVIIGFEDDVNLRRALVVASNIEFYRYEVKFRLINETN
jgi:restriction system protein